MNTGRTNVGLCWIIYSAFEIPGMWISILVLFSCKNFISKPTIAFYYVEPRFLNGWILTSLL